MKKAQIVTSTLVAVTSILTGCANIENKQVLRTQIESVEMPTNTLVTARRQKSDPALNYLTYQHMDKMFGVEWVAKSIPNALPAGRQMRTTDIQVTLDGSKISFDQYLEERKVNAILILRDGKKIYERYRNGSDPSTRFITYSMSKSVVSILIGIAVDEGKIALSDKVSKHIPELKNTAYDRVTVENLLRMRAATDWREIYKPGSELFKFRDLSLNTAEAYYEDYALKAKPDGDPGAKFNYSTLDTNIAGWVLERATGQRLSKYMSEKLWKPAGMESEAYWVLQGKKESPRIFYGAGMSATLRDLGRVGQIMLDEGRVGGKQIVSKSWVAASTSMTTSAPGYGFFWWKAGTDAFAALGINGQAIYVNPKSRTVIVIAGYWPSATDNAWGEERQALFDQISQLPSP